MMNKKDAFADLRKNYNSPGHPIAFSGINAIRKFYGKVLSVRDIEDFLAQSRTYTLHREFKRPVYNPFYCRKIREQFQLDLIEIKQVAKHNNNYNYILVAIDIFSRKLFARLLHRKKGQQPRVVKLN